LTPKSLNGLNELKWLSEYFVKPTLHMQLFCKQNIHHR